MLFRRKKKEEDLEKNRNAVDKIVMGAIIGTAIGSVIGLTMAPKKGSDTRSLIKETFKNRNDLLKKGKERIFDYEDDIKEIGQLAKETTTGVFTLAKNFLFGSKKKTTPSQIREHKDLKKIPNEMIEIQEEKREE